MTIKHLALSLLLTSGAVSGQNAPNAGLVYLQNITVPTWTNTGTNQANYDLFNFNPQTRVMYIADRVNHAIAAIDTRTNAYIGSIPVPGGGSPNGVLVAPDLQQMVVTDGKANVFVYDLRVPSAAPDTYVIPNATSGTDAVEYDPLNQRVYVAVTNAPYFLTAIDLAYEKVSTQFSIPYSPELFKFNPNDGYIYMSITDGDNKNQHAGLMAYDPAGNAMKALYLTPGCVPHGIDIDPVSNTALMGCGAPGGQVLISLKDGTILKTFPDITGTDLLQFSSSTRRWYVFDRGYNEIYTGCPADSTKAFPVIGVIDAQGPAGPNEGREIGVTCTGRNAKLGVDPFQNFVYVGTRQYPVDANDATTGNPGVLVYYDPGPAMPLVNSSQATLSGGAVSGTVRMTQRGRGLRMDATLQGVAGQTAILNVTTTIGNESVVCSLTYAPGAGVCGGALLGDPLLGGVATLGVDGVPAAFGQISATK